MLMLLLLSYFYFILIQADGNPDLTSRYYNNNFVEEIPAVGAPSK